LGIGIGAAQIVLGQKTEDKIEGGIGVLSSALMMSSNPYAIAAGAGLIAGQLLESTFDVSKYSAAYGTAAYQGLKSMGLNDTASFIAGGFVTVLSTPVALQQA